MSIDDLFRKYIDKNKLKEYCEKVKKYTNWLITKNNDNISFFSTQYIGVYPIRFTDSDKDAFLYIFNIEAKEIEKEIKKLDGINTSWKVSTEPVYLTALYVIHLLVKYKVKDSEECIKNLSLVMQFKMLTTIYTQFFSYTVSEKDAQMVIEKMSYFFLNKKYPNNLMVIHHRTELILFTGKNADLIKKGGTENIIYLINRFYNDTKSTIKEYYEILLEVLDSHNRTIDTTTATDDEDNIVIKDKIDMNAIYIEIIKRKVLDINEFYNRSILHLLYDIYKKSHRKSIEATIKHIHELALKNKDKIFKLLEDIIETSLTYLYSVKAYPPYASQIMKTIKILKNIWSSSTTKNENIIRVKNEITELVKESSGVGTSWIISSTTIIVIIYIMVLSVKDVKG
jgi:hypothetical protein